MTAYRKRLPKLLACLALALPANAQNSGYYRQVAPQKQASPPCGHIGTPPCPFDPAKSVDLPPGATAEQLVEYSNEQFRKGDKPGALRSLERAAAMGNLTAMRGAGMALLYGQGVPKNLERGMRYLESAEAKGDGVAAYHLAHAYEDGAGVPADIPKAIRLLNKSAAKQFWLGEFSLGFDYAIGRGVARSNATAITWMQRAATHTNNQTPGEFVSFLRRSGARQFKDVEDLTLAFQTDYIRQRTPQYVPSSGNSAGGPISPNRQYMLNRLGAPGNTCNRPGVTGCQ